MDIKKFLAENKMFNDLFHTEGGKAKLVKTKNCTYIYVEGNGVYLFGEERKIHMAAMFDNEKCINAWRSVGKIFEYDDSKLNALEVHILYNK